jgi:polysaccharide biosynthesis transport protein
MRVVKALESAGKPEFDSMSKGLSPLKQILIATGFSDDPRLMTLEQRAMQRLYRKLTVYPIPDSNVIGIKYSSTDSATAEKVANTLAEIYALSTREAKLGTTGRAREWLSSQIDELRAKVKASDAAVEKFRSEAGLLKGQVVTLGAQEISELNSQITLAEASSSEATARADEIRNLLATTGSVDGSIDVLNSPTIQRLREQQLSASRRLTDLSATYLPSHPKVIAAQKEITEVNKQVRREALKIVEGLQGQAKIAAARAASLRKSMTGLKVRESASAQEDVKLQEFEREAKANRGQLEIMLARYADTNTRQNIDLQPGFARVIQQAGASASPYFPKVGPIVALTTLAGLGLGLSLAFLFEIMVQAARMNEAALLQAQAMNQTRAMPAARTAVEAELPIPELPMPRSATRNMQREVGPEEPFFQPEPQVRPQPASPPAEELQSITNVPLVRNRLEANALLSSFALDADHAAALQSMLSMVAKLQEQGKPGAIAMVGVGAGFETAVSSLALARSLSVMGSKTMLIDLDKRGSLIADLMSLPKCSGMTELVSGSADLTKTIQRDDQSNLQVIQYGANIPGSDNLLAQRMSAVTNTMLGIFDVVLIHAGEAAPSTLSIVQGCSKVVLYAPTARHRDAVAAAATLRSRGIASVNLVQVGHPMVIAA